MFFRRFTERTARAWCLLLFAGLFFCCPGFLKPAAAGRDFIMHSGVNLPWIDYGWDLGDHPWGGQPNGFHRKRRLLEEQFAFLRSKEVKMCRVFLFCDFRTGLRRDDHGNILGLDEYVFADMEVLLDVALKSGIRLIPVLMDYTLANGVEYEYSDDGRKIPVGEFPEFITDPELRGQLFDNALFPFLQRFGEAEAVYAWDIMNEPRLAHAAPWSAIGEFIEEAVLLTNIAAPGALVCVGHYDRYHIDDFGGTVTDLTQVHYYDRMSYYWDFDTPALEISEKPTFFGELEPREVTYKLDTALANDYTGALFWSLNADDGYDFRAVADEYHDWIITQLTGEEFTISFDSAGGSPVAAITGDYGSFFAAPADPERVGCIFVGWSPALPEAIPAGDLEVVARWARPGTISGGDAPTAEDVFLCQMLSVGLPVVIGNSEYAPPYPRWLIDLADMNSDGQVTVEDALLINRQVLGLDP